MRRSAVLSYDAGFPLRGASDSPCSPALENRPRHLLIVASRVVVASRDFFVAQPVGKTQDYPRPKRQALLGRSRRGPAFERAAVTLGEHDVRCLHMATVSCSPISATRY